MQNPNHFSFKALGTTWQIILDRGDSLNTDDEKNIDKSIHFQNLKEMATAFDRLYSRFIPTSLVSRLNRDEEIEADAELAAMLEFGRQLEESSQQRFSLQVGKILGELGYGQGPQALDLGGFGKGWLLDNLAEYLVSQNQHHFLINGGGDIVATSKKDGSPWHVALEHPVDPERAIGTLQLRNASLAASGTGKRRWKQFHHIIDTAKGVPATTHRAVFVIAGRARVADGLSTTLFVSPQAEWQRLAKKYQVEYLILDHATITKSPGFEAGLF